MPSRSFALVLVLSLGAVAAACGDDSGTTAPSITATSAPAASSAGPSTTATPATTPPATTPPATAAPATTATSTTAAPTTSSAPAPSSADFAAYQWAPVADGVPWGARAGLRVVELDGSLFVMGGRTPKNSPIPGDSVLWGDVWRSDDGGATWTNVLPDGGAWPGRAYFQAAVMDGAMYVIGGQNFAFPASTFYNDVWRSTDGVTWEAMTTDAPWVGRAGLMAAAFDGFLYVFGGSRNDDSAVIGPTGPVREYFNDVWRSADGATWEQVAPSAPWEPRAGGASVVHDGALYLLGGEAGFLCAPLPDCELPYFNDVWRTTDGATWEQVTESAGWSPRPGHACEAVSPDGATGAETTEIVCFGGFNPEANPTDMWASPDGAQWDELESVPWAATAPEFIRYDFDSTVVTRDGVEVILTVGGDRETFEFGDPENYLRVDDDVWTWGPLNG